MKECLRDGMACSLAHFSVFSQVSNLGCIEFLNRESEVRFLPGRPIYQRKRPPRSVRGGRFWGQVRANAFESLEFPTYIVCRGGRSGSCGEFAGTQEVSRRVYEERLRQPSSDPRTNGLARSRLRTGNPPATAVQAGTGRRLSLPQHPDQRRPGASDPFAVDQELGEGAALRVAP
jgi:hypothetical protein